MTCAVLCIGTELTRGELTNTNASWLSASLTDLGFEVTEAVVVDDDRGHIEAALDRLGKAYDVVVCTGGLGPTTDDLTSEAVAAYLGVKLERDDASLESIRRRMEKYGRTMSTSNAKQADFPAGDDILVNPVGTAPGFGVSLGKARAFFMPGVPAEMKQMFEAQVAPRIESLAPNDTYQARLRTFGLPESVVGERLADVEAAYPGVVIGYRAHFPEIEVKVLAHAKSQEEARDIVERATSDVRGRLSDVVYGEAGDTFAGVVGCALRRRGFTLAVAESCTGGLVGHLITREPGASEFLLLDAVTYSNASKSRILGVDEEVIRGHGAVSSEVAAAMAKGVKHVSGADVSLAITGIAGPGGGSEDKPIGTVFVAVCSSNGLVVKEKHFPGDRARIQTMAAYLGLSMVREACVIQPSVRDLTRLETH